MNLIFNSGGGPADDGSSLEADLRAFSGTKEGPVGQWMPPKKSIQPETVEIFIFEENETALMVFLNMSTQWIVGGMGSIVGLNYSSLESVMRFFKVKDKADCFSRIRILESEALKLIREQERKENG